MAAPIDIMDDAALNAVHDAHVEAGENHWFSCPLCDDEEVEDE